METQEVINQANELIASGERWPATQLVTHAARHAANRDTLIAFLDQHSPLIDRFQRLLENLAVSASEESKLNLLRSLDDVRDPRFIKPVLGALCALVGKGRPTQFLWRRFQNLFGPPDLAVLRELLMTLNQRQQPEVSELRSVIEVITGTAEPAPALRSDQIPCTRCGWPASYRCKACQNKACESCIRGSHSACSTSTRCHWLEIESGRPYHPTGKLDPGFAELVVLTRDWKKVGAIGVDSGQVSVAPIGPGESLRSQTPHGDGIFPVEARLAEEGEAVEVRVVFEEPIPDRAVVSKSSHGASSRCGYLVLADPYFKPRVDESLLNPELPAGSILQLDGWVLIRASSISVRKLYHSRQLVGWLLRIRARAGLQ